MKKNFGAGDKQTRCFNLPLTIFQQQFQLLWSSNQWVREAIIWVREIAIKETFSYSADFHRLIDDLKILWILNFLQPNHSTEHNTQRTHNRTLSMSAAFFYYYRVSSKPSESQYHFFFAAFIHNSLKLLLSHNPILYLSFLLLSYSRSL
jgi:hypothetical protein